MICRTLPTKALDIATLSGQVSASGRSDSGKQEPAPSVKPLGSCCDVSKGNREDFMNGALRSDC